MFFPNRCSFGTCLMFLRHAHVHAGSECNYYKTLGLNPSASQAEIKAAYYELSKKHHPDRNQGSEESAKIFRLVTAAYEVLGNEKRRMEYDKDRIFQHIRRPVKSYDKDNSPDYKDDAERMHYQSKKRPPFRKYSYGKTSFYDFDAWFEGHYGTDSHGFQFGEPRQFRSTESVRFQRKIVEKDVKTFQRISSLFTFLFYLVLVLFSLSFNKVGKKK